MNKHGVAPSYTRIGGLDAVKLVYCLRRREDMTPDEFARYWRTEHADLVRSNAAALGIKKYVQSHGFSPAVDVELRRNRGLLEAYDGVAEIFFESLEAMGDAEMAPGAQATQAELMADEDKFIDRARSCMFVAQEHPVI